MQFICLYVIIVAEVIKVSKFSVRFKELKDNSHLTLKDISDELGISVSNLSYYMKGREPNYDSLCDIADYFEVTTDYLLGRTDYRTYEEELQVKSTQEELKRLGVEKELNEDDKTDLTQITQLTESLKKKLIPLLVDDVNNRQEIIDIVDEFIDLICTGKKADTIIKAANTFTTSDIS